MIFRSFLSAKVKAQELVIIGLIANTQGVFFETIDCKAKPQIKRSC